jgi:hypothetical protein
MKPTTRFIAVITDRTPTDTLDKRKKKAGKIEYLYIFDFKDPNKIQKCDLYLNGRMTNCNDTAFTIKDRKLIFRDFETNYIYGYDHKVAMTKLTNYVKFAKKCKNSRVIETDDLNEIIDQNLIDLAVDDIDAMNQSRRAIKNSIDRLHNTSVGDRKSNFDNLLLIDTTYNTGGHSYLHPETGERVKIKLNGVHTVVHKEENLYFNGQEFLRRATSRFDKPIIKKVKKSDIKVLNELYRRYLNDVKRLKLTLKNMADIIVNDI